MKKTILAALLGIVLAMPATAQSYRNSRYYNPSTGQLDYKNGGHGWRNPDDMADTYVGLRIGPTFTFVSSDDPALDGGTMKTGLNVGVVGGWRVVRDAPLYLETGLFYTEKGGKGKGGSNGNFTYNLNYLEIPLMFKYRYALDDDLRLEPFFGGFFAIGTGGRIKDYNNREAYSSFSGDPDGSFSRCDGGLKFGIGVSYDMFYADLGYDLGLANICHDSFDVSHSGALTINVGVNF